MLALVKLSEKPFVEALLPVPPPPKYPQNCIACVPVDEAVEPYSTNGDVADEYIK